MNHPLPEITQIRHRIGVLTANKLSRFDVLWLCIIALVFQLATFNLNAQQPAFLTNGLVAYYPFNGNANDESGNGNNATTRGDFSYVQNVSPFANAIQTKGDGPIPYKSGGYVELPDLSKMVNNEVAIIFWAKSLDPLVLDYPLSFGVNNRCIYIIFDAQE